MLTTMKSMLKHANDNNYAIMAVNCINFEIAKSIIDSAVEVDSPVIINISPRQFKEHARLEMILPMIKNMAKSVHVPIAINLDHGQLYDDIIYALEMGYTSIMFDGSTLSFEENIKRTQLVKTLTDEYGCSLEAELGHVGQANREDQYNDDFLTDVDQAFEFIQKTGVDCLAVAIGTAHGEYPQNIIPQIDFNRLNLLKEKLEIPLVLHGGSGAGEDNIRQAVRCGINKINVCTDLFNIRRDTLKKELDIKPNIELMVLENKTERAMKKFIMDYMELIGSANRYTY